VAALIGHQRADDAQLVHLLGDGRQHLADLNARGLGLARLELTRGLGARLEVPQVQVTGAAAHPEDDEALVFLLEGVLRRAQAVEELQARHGQGGEACHVLEEVSPVHPRVHVL
jgi:hypothetical protein